MDLRRILLNLKIARRSLVQFKWRTSLAVLGVFFGTFSEVAPCTWVLQIHSHEIILARHLRIAD